MAKKLLVAYCLKTKQKEEMYEAEISKTAKGGFICKGTTKDKSSKLSLIMSEANALKVIEEGVAKKGF